MVSNFLSTSESILGVILEYALCICDILLDVDIQYLEYLIIKEIRYYRNKANTKTPPQKRHLNLSR